jgi:hypothetical protein
MPATNNSNAAFGVAPKESHHSFLSRIEDYASQATSISPKERKNLKAAALKIAETNPADAYAFVSEFGKGYTNYRPTRLLGRLVTQPVDYSKFGTIAKSAFQDLLNREGTEGELNKYNKMAKAMGIRDADAFDQFISGRLASTREGAEKLKSEADYENEARYGTMTRNAQGELNRGQYLFRPELINSAVQQMLGRG